MKALSYASMDTPAGKIYIRELTGNITYIGFEDPHQNETVTPLIRKTIDQLNEYFNGERKEFSVPFGVNGSELQVAVCDSLLKIPYGETRTYKEISEDIGNPKAIRAVASTIGKNPVSIIIPCHRVIGSDGKMRGYAGGIPFKEFLLGVEGRKPQKK
jgi:methylated-DNA-[protein]-cysteine S-methyltransferase